MSSVNVPVPTSRSVPHFPVWAPMLLAFSAGFVDAALFLAFAGFFVAQATGSFVVLGTALTHWTGAAAIKVAAIPVFFVSAFLATVIIRILGTATTRAMMVTLCAEAALLAAVMAIGLREAAGGSAVTAGELLGLSAMGIQAAFASSYLSGYGSTNVMTTNTITFACALADKCCGRQDNPKLLPTAFVLMSFLIGTVAGGIAFTGSGYLCLLLPILLILGFALSESGLVIVRQPIPERD